MKTINIKNKEVFEEKTGEQVWIFVINWSQVTTKEANK